MAREGLLSASTTASAPVEITSCHEQLRDLLVCPTERGVVSYISHQSIMTHDIRTNELPKQVANLNFLPNCLSIGCGIMAAGGQKADIYMSNRVTYPQSGPTRAWSYTQTLSRPASINNSIFLTSSNLTPSSSFTPSSGEPRLFVSNNDSTIKAFTVKSRSANVEGVDTECLSPCGLLALTTPINHASISPDGRTMLAVGDTNETFLYNVNGGETITFEKISKYVAGNDAGFSTAWSSDGRKFAVASQDGQVTTWDTRSSKPLAIFYTLDKPSSIPTTNHRGHPPPPHRLPPWAVPRRPLNQDARRRANSSDDALSAERVPFPQSDQLESARGIRAGGQGDRTWYIGNSSVPTAGSSSAQNDQRMDSEEWDLRLPPIRGPDINDSAQSSQVASSSTRTASSSFQLPTTWYHSTDIIPGAPGVRGTIGASSTSIPPQSHFDPSPRNPARALKFSPCEGEGELLVFTEQTTRFHAIDARTFNQHDIVKVPVYHPGHQERRNSVSRSSSVDSNRTASASSPSIRPSWSSMLGVPSQQGDTSQDGSQDVDQLREDDGDGDDTEMEELAQLENTTWGGLTRVNRSLDEIEREGEGSTNRMNSQMWRPLPPTFSSGLRTSAAPPTTASATTTGGYRLFASRAPATTIPSRYTVYFDSGMAGVGAGYGPEAEGAGVRRMPPTYPGESDPQITGISFDPSGRWVYVGTEWGLYEWEIEGRRRAFGVEEIGDYA